MEYDLNQGDAMRFTADLRSVWIPLSLDLTRAS